VNGKVNHTTLGAGCRLASFKPVRDAGAEEVHLFIEPTHDGSFESQLADVTRQYHAALDRLKLSRQSAVFRRCFVSDAAEQQELVMASPLGLAVPDAESAAVSCIQQPPLSGKHINLWAYHLSDVTAADKSVMPMPGGGLHARTLVVQRQDRRLLWTGQMTGDPPASETANPRAQTDRLFDAYTEMLQSQGANLLDHTVRTWLFVHQIEPHYGGMVDARRELFERHGLTPQSHYIVSTGIEGRTADPRNLVTMDALAISGLATEQLIYLDRLDHLNRTDEYGVTFERAVRLDYADRSHLYVAGTASIGPDGSVLHIGKIVPQVKRTIETITALLEAGKMSMADVATMIVYVRDDINGDVVRDTLKTLVPGLPFTLVHAPVCRPTWLVEIEVLAITSNDDPRWPSY
jgi:enamine deaminase RidA (YjgF/YER057c/UK114 family)